MFIIKSSFTFLGVMNNFLILNIMKSVVTKKYNPIPLQFK